MSEKKPIDLSKLTDLGHRLIESNIVDCELNDELCALTIEEGRTLDAIAFQCVECEHWYAAHERREVQYRWLCKECADG